VNVGVGLVGAEACLGGAEGGLVNVGVGLVNVGVGLADAEAGLGGAEAGLVSVGVGLVGAEA
jgi:hypothetical protein